MDDTYKVYFSFLEKLGEELEELAGIEREKAQAVRRDDLMAVNDCMRREQAISMTLRGMDHERESLLARLGLSGVPLSGLAAECPEEIRPQAREVADRLKARYDVYRSAADAARSLLEASLHQIDQIIEEQGLEQDNLPVNRLHNGSFADIRA